jgi:hypothetical protein
VVQVKVCVGNAVKLDIENIIKKNGPTMTAVFVLSVEKTTGTSSIQIARAFAKSAS